MQKNSLLLRFLKLRLVVNGMHIYALMKNRPVVITLQTAPSKLVVTDGYHISAPFQVNYLPNKTKYYVVACLVENDVLVGAAVVSIMFFFMGLTSGYITMLLLSFAPLVSLLSVYYFRRKEFIQIKPV